jgi:hypothetical protein
LQQQVAGLVPAALHATSSSSLSSSSSSTTPFPQQHQQATVNHNTHPLSSSWQQLFQSPPNSNNISNHPMMMHSLQTV